MDPRHRHRHPFRTPFGSRVLGQWAGTGHAPAKATLFPPRPAHRVCGGAARPRGRCRRRQGGGGRREFDSALGRDQSSRRFVGCGESGEETHQTTRRRRVREGQRAPGLGGLFAQSATVTLAHGMRKQAHHPTALLHASRRPGSEEHGREEREARREDAWQQHRESQ